MTWALLLFVLAPGAEQHRPDEVVHVTQSYHLTERECREAGEKLYQSLRDLGRKAQWECRQAPAP